MSNKVKELEWRKMVKQLAKPGEQIAMSVDIKKLEKWHMATGVVGEAGELIDAVKKEVIYNKAPDQENIIEELGDLEFYMEGIRQAYGISRSETLQANWDKLAERYAGHQYSDKAAQDRADKVA
jgi:NTP pyrophosphatase (non-canonical NTP hydrolase)